MTHKTLTNIETHLCRDSLQPHGVQSLSTPQEIELAIASDEHSRNLARFWRKAHSISLLDQLLRVLQCTPEIKQDKILALMDLDSKTRDLIATVIRDDDQRQTTHAAAIALAVR
jgi:hypothetical protein